MQLILMIITNNQVHVELMVYSFDWKITFSMPS